MLIAVRRPLVFRAGLLDHGRDNARLGVSATLLLHTACYHTLSDSGCGLAYHELQGCIEQLVSRVSDSDFPGSEVTFELSSRHPLRDVSEEGEHFDEVFTRGVRLVQDLDGCLGQVEVLVSGIRVPNTVNDAQYRRTKDAA